MDRCIILGSGCSLKGFNFWTLKNEHVITVNKMAYFAPFAKHCCFWDISFWEREHKRISKHKGQLHSIVDVKVTRKGQPIHRTIEHPRVKSWRVFGDGIINRLDGMVGNNNMSILFAFNVALHYGYKDFYILGADNGFNNQRVHFYDKKDKDKRQHEIYTSAFECMYDRCNRIKPHLLEDESITIVGDSTLDMFNRMTLDEFKDTL